MTNIEKLQALVDQFQVSLPYYKDTKNNYNEHSCRIEYIDPLLKILGWDVANEKGLLPQYREVIAENYSTPTDRPDYTMTLRGVAKFFVEAKKPAVDITRTIATFKNDVSRKRQQTNADSPEEKHKQEPHELRQGEDPDCGLSIYEGLL